LSGISYKDKKPKEEERILLQAFEITHNRNIERMKIKKL
jgi:hypothetical protein